MKKKQEKTITSYGLYAYRVRPGASSMPRSGTPRQWDLEATLHSEEAAIMQGKILSLQPEVEKVEILRQICTPQTGLCDGRVIKTFRKKKARAGNTMIWLSGAISGIGALAGWAFFMNS